MPVSRLIGNHIFSWLTGKVARIPINLDAQCGYTVIRRAALCSLRLDDLYDRYGFPNEMLFAAMRAGLSIESVPVRSVYENEVSGINPLTTVPIILFLIARSFLRARLSFQNARVALAVQKSESNSVK